VLQCVAVCCSVLQCVAVCCNVLQCVAVRFSVFQNLRVCFMFILEAFFKSQLATTSNAEDGYELTFVFILEAFLECQLDAKSNALNGYALTAEKFHQHISSKIDSSLSGKREQVSISKRKKKNPNLALQSVYRVYLVAR